MAKRLYIQLYNETTGESITLPLNPESTDITNEKDVKTYNILGYGEVSIGGNKLLKHLTLTNVFPDNETFFALLASLVKQLNYKPYSLQETIEMINRWVNNNDIIRVIISGHLNSEFRIASFTQSIRESISDVGYTIELVEYRNPEKENIVQKTVSSKIVNLKERAIKKYIPSQITGQAGQTIYKLAKLTYGGRWQELAQKNGVTNANISLAGQIVEMLPL
jgi:calcineurin-like phosphoesterase family protein